MTAECALRNFLLAVLLIATTAALPAAEAHGVGLDSSGCHHNREAGGYHCHGGPMAGQQFGSNGEAQRRLTSDQSSESALEKFPIAVAIDATVAGEVVKIRRRTDCFLEHLPLPIRHLGPRWKQGRVHFRHRLNSGSWFLLQVENSCPNVPSSVNFFDKTNFPVAAILDRIEKPNYIELYSPVPGFYSSKIARNSAIDLEKLTIKYTRDISKTPRRLREADVSQANLNITGATLEGGVQPRSFASPRVLALGRIWVLPESLWSNQPFLARHVRPVREVLRLDLSREEFKKFLKYRFELFSRAEAELKKHQSSLKPAPQYHFVPLKPVAENIWAPNWSRAAIFQQYFVGRLCIETEKIQVTESYHSSNWNKNQIIIHNNTNISGDGINIYYDHSRKIVFHTVKFSFTHFYD